MAEQLRRSLAPALPTILFADASEDYRAMARDALLEARNPTDLRFARSGPELLAYLHGESPLVAPQPALIVVDLDLPGEPGGIDAVRAIKSNPAVRRIPVVALTANSEPATVVRAYDAGVNTYITKPVTFLALVRLMKVFTAYWLETAELPPAEAV